MESLLIYSGVGDSDVQWLVLDKSGSPTSESGQDDLATVAARASGRRLIWLIKGEDVWLAQRKVVAASKRQLAQALPYALEDELASDVDSLLFAHAPVGEETGVAVIDRGLLTGGLELLQQHGLKPGRILPDLVLLPLADDSWYLRQDGERVLLRKGPVDGFVCDRHTLPLMLDSALAQAGEGPPASLLLAGDPALLADCAGLPEVKQVDEVGLLTLLASGLPQAPRVDFGALLGSGNLFSPADRRRWSIAAALAVLALGLAAGERWLAVDRLQQHNQQLSQAIERVYLDTFPQSRPENPPVQMEQKLQALRKGGSDGGFLAALAGVVNELAAVEGLKVEGLEYRSSLLVLRLQGKDLQQLNSLKQAIEKGGERTAEIQSVNQVDTGVSAQMKIREGRA